MLDIRSLHLQTSIQIMLTDIYNTFKALLIPDIFVQSPICVCFKYKVKLINVRIVASYKSLQSATLNYDIFNYKIGFIKMKTWNV